jgi:lysophospholipase L1-like esterase
VTSNPRLMTVDHVHFTSDGYKLSAKAFLTFLTPTINQLRLRKYAFSNN